MLNKIKIIFLINLLLLLALLLTSIYYIYDISSNRGNILIAIIVLCIVLLFSIMHLLLSANAAIKDEKKIRVSEQIITLTTIIMFFLVIQGMFLSSFSQMIEQKRLDQMKMDINKLLLNSNEILDKNNIYNLKKLRTLNIKLNKSPFGYKYKSNSYITTFDNINDICITDGKYSITKDKKGLISNKGNICNFELDEKKSILYIKYKLGKKYNIKFDVYNCKEIYDYESVFYGKNGFECKISYNNNEYSAKVYDKTLEIMDSFIVD